ncbi:cysteine hydrolase family protein [Pelotalea chapellei]|uniref:Cysteine hydrolase n=1 Tax=Pelotalea chapellei TaxID=44671 RepID=A0ABS5UB90_9BACT|nr:cysteine hydrolase family protein [Pelotalea chapellei]MBT1072908.1 cysteine hydrolase [Pelotalea chapellei]
MITALVMIDIQNDYFPGGNMELVGAEAAGQRAKEVLDCFRNHNLPVIHIRHISSRPDATFFLPGTPGSEIHPSVAPLAGEIVFVKNFPNSFRETPLLEYLRGLGIEKLVLAGMMTSMCVDATARASFDLGFQNILLHDAMATRNLSFNGATIPAAEVHGAFLAALGSVYGRVIGVTEFLEASPVNRN